MPGSVNKDLPGHGKKEPEISTETLSGTGGEPA